MRKRELLKTAVIGATLVAGLLRLQAATTYTFQEGVNGYAGTHDTEIRGGTPDRDDGALDSLSIDTSDGGGQNHVLLRFEKLSGTGPNQIPPGSSVLLATLRLWITSDGNPPGLHRMLKPWDESLTWNVFDPVNSDGIQADGVEAAIDPDATFEAPNGEPYFVEIPLNTTTIQEWLDGKKPNYGWALIPTGSNGVDFDASENSNVETRPLLTIVVGVAGEAFVRSFNSSPLGFSVQVEDGILANGQRNAINQASIAVTFDGAKVTPTATKAANVTTVSYTLATGYLAAKSAHSATLAFADSATPPKTVTIERSFIVADFTTVPAAYAVTGVDTTKPGFKARVHQMGVRRPGGDQNGLNMAEKQLANAIINPDTAKPYDNEADLSQAKNGIFEIPGIINWNQDAPAAVGNFSSGSTPAIEDQPIPGIPGINGSTDNIAAEVTTYIELKAGFHRLGVNSDDGFRVTVGPSPSDAFATRLGFFDTGRGSADTLFDFAVEKDGFYPFRLSWWEGGGGANLEFFSVDIATSQKILINDSSNPKAIKAYREGPADVFGPRPGLKLLIAVDDKQKWKYEESGTDQGTAWREKNFNDATWKDGFALLGFESGSIADTLRTEVTRGPLTFYFRTRFNFDGDPAATQLRLLHVIDDGAVFYLNGVEVSRFAMPAGAVKFNTGSTGHENDYEGPFEISAASLVKGENVLAVEAHQTDTGSSDMVMGVELWAAPGGAAVAPPPAVATLDVRVAGGLDDSEEHLTEANAIDITSSDLELGAEGGGGDTQAIGIRFRNINLPAGSTITSATIQFTVDEADDEPTSVRIYGELSTNPIEYSTVAGDITGRKKTAASVEWNNIPVWNAASIGAAGPDQRTPDLSPIVRELIGQPGWTANNAMAFIIMPNPGGERTAEAFNGDAAAAPLLHIEYMAPSAPPSPPELGALLVIGTASIPNLNASDSGLKARLESQGWKVTVVQAPASKTADADGKQLIVISSTVASGDVGTKFRNSAVPVLNWEQAVQDDFLMTGNAAADHATTDAQTQINIVKADHPLAAGLATGLKTVTTAPLPYSWGLPNANAVKIATIANNPAQVLIYGYEKGAMLVDGTTAAPARRAMFFMGDDAFAALTPDGLKLFDAAVSWAANLAPKPAGPSLSLARSATGLTLTFTGTLQSADVVTGPWTDVANAASPLSVSATGAQKFYRAKQ